MQQVSNEFSSIVKHISTKAPALLVEGNWGLRDPALFFVCLLYHLLNDAQKLHWNSPPQGPCLS